MLKAKRSFTIGGVKQGRSGKNKPFLVLHVNISKTVGDTSTLLLITNRKSHMRFRLTPRSMTFDDLTCYKFEFFRNFAGFRRFGSQQQLNEWR